jgi:hypothetical protein
MKTIIVILTIIAVVLMMIGAGCFSIVQIRQRKRTNRYFVSIFKESTEADIKLMKIGAIIALLGFLIIVILRIVLGPTIYLGCG